MEVSDRFRETKVEEIRLFDIRPGRSVNCLRRAFGYDAFRRRRAGTDPLLARNLFG